MSKSFYGYGERGDYYFLYIRKHTSPDEHESLKFKFDL